MKLSIALASLLSAPGFCLTFNSSPTLERLQGEAQRDPASLSSREASRNAASSGFTGERLSDQNIPAAVTRDAQDAPTDAPATEPAPKKGTPTYIFTGNSPIKGLTIYTPKEDPTGNGGNEKPKTKEPINKWLVYGALGAGAAATIAGIFFPPLLFLGGLLLGAGAVLGYIRHKINAATGSN
jgi:hypothetical protein